MKEFAQAGIAVAQVVRTIFVSIITMEIHIRSQLRLVGILTSSGVAPVMIQT